MADDDTDTAYTGPNLGPMQKKSANSDDLPSAPWAKSSKASSSEGDDSLPSAPWATKNDSSLPEEPADHGLSERQKLSPIGKALSPITSYPETYQRMNKEAREQVSHGVEQLKDPESAWDVAKGAGNVALGSAGYVWSPVSAAYRSIAGQPIEDVTGIPREYTEFAAQLATPGIGIAGAKPVPKPIGPPKPAFNDPFGVIRTEGQTSGDINAIRREQAAGRGLLGDKARVQAEDFRAQQGQQLEAAKDSVVKSLDPNGGQALADSPQEAAQMAQQSLQREAARSKAGVTQAYDAAKALPGEIHSDVFKDMAVNLREDLNAGHSPVVVDEGTPVAARMLKYLDDRISKLKIRNDADLANPLPGSIAGVTLEGVNQLRKGLSTLRSDALAAYGSNPSDARAAQAIIRAFDKRIDAAVNSGMFTGDPRAVQAWNAARAAHAERMRLFGNDPVGRKLQQIVGDARFDKDPASVNDVAKFLYSGDTSPTSLHIGVAKRLQKVLGADSPEWAAIRQGYFHRLTSTAEGVKDRGVGTIATRLAEALNGKGQGLAEVMFTPPQRDMLREYAALHRSLEVPATGANWSETSTFVGPILKHISTSIASMVGAVIGHTIAPGLYGMGELAGAAIAGKGSTMVENATNARRIQQQMPLVSDRINQWKQAVAAQQRGASVSNQTRLAAATTNLTTALGKLGFDQGQTMRLLQTGVQGPGDSNANENSNGLDTSNWGTKRARGGPVLERPETLIEQQKQLVNGDRHAQLFPGGHGELALPKGMYRAKMENGDVFHYSPKKTNVNKLKAASKGGRENEVLGLGPVSKNEAVRRTARGEHPVAVVERTPRHVEVRAAAGTHKTAAAQIAAMRKNKSAHNSVALERPDYTVAMRGRASGGSVRKPGDTYNTQLDPLQEFSYRQWVQDNHVPTNPDESSPDYDMRGFWQGLQQQNPKAQSAIDPNDNRLHYPDYWKTPSHETFSNESQWATPNSPGWSNDDKLISPNGRILYDDRAPKPEIQGFDEGGVPTFDDRFNAVNEAPDAWKDKEADAGLESSGFTPASKGPAVPPASASESVLGRAWNTVKPYAQAVGDVSKRFAQYDRQMTEDVLNVPKNLYNDLTTPRKDVGKSHPVVDDVAYDPTGVQITPNVADEASSAEPQTRTSKALNRLIGTQFGEDRYQTWPERMIRSGASLPHDVITGEQPTQAVDPETGEVHTAPSLVERSQDLAGMAGTGGLGGIAEGSGSALGSAPFLRPALKYEGKIYKAPVGGQHLDAIPPEVYPEFRRQAMNGEDISNFNFGFMNHKGQFLDREKALDYAIKEGLVDEHAARYGALTTPILSDSSEVGAPLSALEKAQQRGWGVVRGNDKGIRVYEEPPVNPIDPNETFAGMKVNRLTDLSDPKQFELAEKFAWQRARSDIIKEHGRTFERENPDAFDEALYEKTHEYLGDISAQIEKDASNSKKSYVAMTPQGHYITRSYESPQAAMQAAQEKMNSGFRPSDIYQMRGGSTKVLSDSSEVGAPLSALEKEAIRAPEMELKQAPNNPVAKYQPEALSDDLQKFLKLSQGYENKLGPDWISKLTPEQIQELKSTPAFIKTLKNIDDAKNAGAFAKVFETPINRRSLFGAATTLATTVSNASKLVGMLEKLTPPPVDVAAQSLSKIAANKEIFDARSNKVMGDYWRQQQELRHAKEKALKEVYARWEQRGSLLDDGAHDQLAAEVKQVENSYKPQEDQLQRKMIKEHQALRDESQKTLAQHREDLNLPKLNENQQRVLDYVTHNNPSLNGDFTDRGIRQNPYLLKEEVDPESLARWENNKTRYASGDHYDVPYLLARMSPEEKAQIAEHIKPALLQDPDLALRDARALAKAFPSLKGFALFSDTSQPGAAIAGLKYANPFYSAVEKTIESAKQSKMHGEQWANWLKNQPGVKPEELEHTGIDKWLREQKGPVTKEQVQEQFAKNKVEVEDTVRGGVPNLNNPPAFVKEKYSDILNKPGASPEDIRNKIQQRAREAFYDIENNYARVKDAILDRATAEHDKILDPANEEYQKIADAAHNEHRAATKLAEQEFNDATREHNAILQQTIDAAEEKYAEALKPLGARYRRLTDELNRQHREGLIPENESHSKSDMLYDDYNRTRNEINKEFNKAGADAHHQFDEETRPALEKRNKSLTEADNKLDAVLEPAKEKRRQAREKADKAYNDIIDEISSLPEKKQYEQARDEINRINNFFEGKRVKYESYKLPGGKNYREHLITLGDKSEKPPPPTKEQLNEYAQDWHSRDFDRLSERRQRDILDEITKKQVKYQSGHWDEPDVLAHVRTTDRDVSGVPAMHVEEVQSDWHQQGRKQGYKSGFNPKDFDIKELPNKEGFELTYNDKFEEPINIGTFKSKSEANDFIRKGEIPERLGNVLKEGDIHRGQIADAPFEKSWSSMAMKRTIQKAVEEGKSRVSWTLGKEHAERYGLSHVVKEFHVEPNSSFSKLTWDPNTIRGHVGQIVTNFEGKIVSASPYFGDIEGKGIDEVVGKEFANKVLNDFHEIAAKSKEARDLYNTGAAEDSKKAEKILDNLERSKTYAGHDLEIGGEGMKGFYDTMMPKIVEKIGKEMKVDLKPKYGELQTDPYTPYEMYEGNWTLLDANDNEVGRQHYNSREEAEAAAVKEKPPAIKVMYFDIPPAMQEKVAKEGFSLFSDTSMAGAPLSALEHQNLTTLKHSDLSNVALKSPLSKKEQAAVDGYLEYEPFEEHQINLRKGRMGPQDSDETKSLHSAISKAELPQDLTLHRGISAMTDNFGRSPGKKLLENLEKLKVGDVMQDNGFMSTSLYKGNASDYGPESTGLDGAMLVIRAKQGDQALPIGNGHHNEVVFQAGTKLRLVDKKPGEYVFETTKEGKPVFSDTAALSGPANQNSDHEQQKVNGPGKKKETNNEVARAKGGRVVASNINHRPSEAQKAAGNYAKDHVNIHGLNITIENAKGSIRRGQDADGTEWKATLPAHYGYIKRTTGADKDHLDVYIGPHIKSKQVYVINQIDLNTKQFDETKTILGCGSLQQALSTYVKAFSDGKGLHRIGSVVATDITKFKHWLNTSNTKKPFTSKT